jgi:hypothetical protein
MITKEKSYFLKNNKRSSGNSENIQQLEQGRRLHITHDMEESTEFLKLSTPTTKMGHRTGQS